MVYLITDRGTHFNVYDDNIVQLSVDDGIVKIQQYLDALILDENPCVSIDIESNGLDPFINDVLLTAIGDKNVQFVIDSVGDNNDVFTLLNSYVDDITFVGHNIKFDHSMLMVNKNLLMQKFYDTMVAHQRLFTNSGISASLQNLTATCLGINLAKDVRDEFIGVNPNTFTFETKHILYAAEDIQYLIDIKAFQSNKIDEFKMRFLLEEIEFPLIPVLAKAELEGFVLDEEEWRKIYEENLEEAFNLEVKLDNEFRRLRDSLLKRGTKEYMRISAGKFDRPRNKPLEDNNKDLFGNPADYSSLKARQRPKPSGLNNINYSWQTLLIIFGSLGLELPLKDESGYACPILRRDSNKLSGASPEVTTNAKALEAFVIERPNNPANNFLETLVAYRKVCKEIETYGLNFIEKINPVTGKLHTIFRQTSTKNGRLSSGGGKDKKDENGRIIKGQEDRINGQNIPAKKRTRNCFKTDEGYKIMTIDLSGAEVIVMASKAQDFRLLELSGTDIHSHMAMNGWRNIFMYRLCKRLGLCYDNKSFSALTLRADFKDFVETKLKQAKDDKENLRLWKESNEFIVSKTVNTESHRKPCKNLTFGSVYGCKARKAGKTINVAKDEGQIYINTIEREIPDTFLLMKRNVKLACKQGYLVLNERTNSRVWFPPALRAKNSGTELSRKDHAEIDDKARNIPISGTQADMVKEAMVEIDREFVKRRWDAKIILQVHDELVIKIEDSIVPEVSEFVNNKFIEVANRYLTNVEMGADYNILDCWTK